MNIEDKARLFAGVRRVLRRGSWFAIYDVMRAGTGQIDYPVLWAARDADASFAAETQTYRSLLVQA